MKKKKIPVFPTLVILGIVVLIIVLILLINHTKSADKQNQSGETNETTVTSDKAVVGDYTCEIITKRYLDCIEKEWDKDKCWAMINYYNDNFCEVYKDLNNPIWNNVTDTTPKLTYNNNIPSISFFGVKVDINNGIIPNVSTLKYFIQNATISDSKKDSLEYNNIVIAIDVLAKQSLYNYWADPFREYLTSQYPEFK